jgi:hypothetical protein
MARVWIKGHWKIIRDKNGRKKRIWVKGYWKNIQKGGFFNFSF